MSILRFAVVFFVVLAASYGVESGADALVQKQKFFTWKTSKEGNFYALPNGDLGFRLGLLDDHKLNKIFAGVTWTSMRDINKDNPLVDVAVKIFKNGFERGLKQLQFLTIEEANECLIMAQRAVLQDELHGRFDKLAQVVGYENSYNKELTFACNVMKYLLSPAAKEPIVQPS